MNHLAGIGLTDREFGTTGRIDLLLGEEVFVDVMRHGRRIGYPGSPVAFETDFGSILAGSTEIIFPAMAFNKSQPRLVMTSCEDFGILKRNP